MDALQYGRTRRLDPAAPAPREWYATVPVVDRGSPGGVRGFGNDFFGGARLFWRGLRMYGRDPRSLLLGTIPALISLLIVAAGIGTLIYFISDLAALATWFADDWSHTVRTTVRIVAGVTIVGVAVLLSAVTYTALTLVIGDPFYEVISARIDQRAGGTPTGAELPWRVTFIRNLVDSVRLLLLSLSVSIPLFLAGLLPVVGQSVVPVLDVLCGGWLLAVELTGVPFNRRGLRLADRRRLLRANRAMALGFGVPVFLLLLVPFVAVIVIPAAVAGSTLLTRAILDDRPAPIAP